MSIPEEDWNKHSCLACLVSSLLPGLNEPTTFSELIFVIKSNCCSVDWSVTATRFGSEKEKKWPLCRAPWFDQLFLFWFNSSTTIFRNWFLPNTLLSCLVNVYFCLSNQNERFQVYGFKENQNKNDPFTLTSSRNDKKDLWGLKKKLVCSPENVQLKATFIFWITVFQGLVLSIIERNIVATF